MAQIILGAKTVLNLSTDLDPMFTEIYNGSLFNTFTSATFGAGAAVRQVRVNGGAAAAEGSAFTGLRGGANSFILGNAGAILGGSESGDVMLYSYGTVNQRFYTNGVERMRIDGSGSVSVGSSGASVGAGSLGRLFAVSGSASVPGIVVQGSGPSQGVIAFGTSSPAYQIRGGADYVGMDFTVAGAVQGGFDSTAFKPGADNSKSLGLGAFRWSVVYAGTGAINTSDAREKTKVSPLTPNELKCAIALSKEVGVFKFLDSIEAKGDDARIHCGMTVQRAIEVMEDHGLVPRAYAFICYDEWDAVEHPAEYKEEERRTGAFDADGKEITETVKTVTREAYTTPAGNRYGFRTDQLALFIARGQAQRQDELEARIAALEA